MTLDGLKAALDTANTFQRSSDFDLNPDLDLPAERKLRPAAVLVPLVKRSSGWQVILTKRTHALKHHPGQIAFPGGKVDVADANPQSAALREAYEEIGLMQQHVQIMGTLPNHETVTGFDVHPFVGLVDPTFQAIAELGEVEEVFEAPLSLVVNSANFLVQSRRWLKQDRFYYTIPYGPYYIWGATARILRSFAAGYEDAHANKS